MHKQDINVLNMALTAKFNIKFKLGDSHFGSKTSQGVRMYQELFNEETSGVVSKHLWHEIMEATKEMIKNAREGKTS